MNLFIFCFLLSCSLHVVRCRDWHILFCTLLPKTPKSCQCWKDENHFFCVRALRGMLRGIVVLWEMGLGHRSSCLHKSAIVLMRLTQSSVWPVAVNRYGFFNGWCWYLKSRVADGLYVNIMMTNEIEYLLQIHWIIETRNVYYHLTRSLELIQ